MQPTFTIGITDDRRNSLIERKGVTELDTNLADRTAAFREAGGAAVIWSWSSLNGFYAVEEKPSTADGTPPDRNLERARRASTL